MTLSQATKLFVAGFFFAVLPMMGPARATDLDLSAYKGKVVYLDFWASWCTPCRLSFPWMNEIQQSYGPNGLVIIGINVDHDRTLAENFLRATNPDFKILYDPNGEIAGHYDFKDMPTSVLIGRDGRIHATHGGFLPEREGAYLSDIVALLNQKVP
jgi:cytochrome c biogenesis protein CcmG, thiol:disulfide interchange protein DsbE